MLLVVGDLLFPVRLRDAQQVLDCVGLFVGVEDDSPLLVAGGPTSRLHERGRRPKESLLVGVENRDKRDFWKVEAFAQEVDPYEDVKLALPETMEYRDALDRVDVAMKVLYADAGAVEILRQVFGRPLGERRDENAVSSGDDALDLLH